MGIYGAKDIWVLRVGMLFLGLVGRDGIAISFFGSFSDLGDTVEFERMVYHG